MSNIRLIVTAIILVLLAASASQALVLRQDNSRLHKGDGVARVVSPNQKWCSEILPTSRTLVRAGDVASNRQEFDRGSARLGVRPTYVEAGRNQMSPYRVADRASANNPNREWTHGIDRGITRGLKPGGVWTTSNSTADGQYKPFLNAFGTGVPNVVPEPGAFVSLFAGIAGLGLTRMLRRKK